VPLSAAVLESISFASPTSISLASSISVGDYLDCRKDDLGDMMNRGVVCSFRLSSSFYHLDSRFCQRERSPFVVAD
jgi:hypothetical protein